MTHRLLVDFLLFKAEYIPSQKKTNRKVVVWLLNELRECSGCGRWMGWEQGLRLPRGCNYKIQSPEIRVGPNRLHIIPAIESSVQTRVTNPRANNCGWREIKCLRLVYFHAHGLAIILEGPTLRIHFGLEQEWLSITYSSN